MLGMLFKYLSTSERKIKAQYNTDIKLLRRKYYRTIITQNNNIINYVKRIPYDNPMDSFTSAKKMDALFRDNYMKQMKDTGYIIDRGND